MILRISPSQLESWFCKERWNLTYRHNVRPVTPNIYYAFGSAIHRMAYAYWSGWDYEKAYSFALMPALQDHTQQYWFDKFDCDAFTTVVYPDRLTCKSSYVDNRLLTAKQLEKWNARLDNLAKLASLYYSHHGAAHQNEPALLNEQFIEWTWGEYAGYEIRCCGIIDRVQQGTLYDTKTCSAFDRNWKQSVKWDNIRRPQLSFYYRYCLEHGHVEINQIAVEAIVQPYRGSEPEIAVIDITKELVAGYERSVQQMDWAIREIATFCRDAADASPWPMNRAICVDKYGECDYLYACDLRASVTDERYYTIHT